MGLNSGQELGGYEIVTSIGSGGMGEVYRAKDLALGRDVAIKILPDELASDPTRLARFEREARAASALNHPNIITIYQIGKQDRTRFIAMELVIGKTLREVLDDGPIEIRKLLRIASQTAEGLAKAHAAGIVHRDLKPENLMVTTDGYVKILDFGLAKWITPSTARDPEKSTLTRGVTIPGAVMGTVFYMSPEQAQGHEADYRSDQFSFGTILYEMATGTLPFARETSPQTLAAIIEREPAQPIATAKPDLPAPFRWLIERCLAKAPDDRYDSTRDMARDLGAILEHLPELGSGVSIRSGGMENRSKPREELRSLAVLPLGNLSADPEQEYFADGMTESLIAVLARIGSLKVTSRTSAMRHKNTNRPLPEIARELEVDVVVEGSVMRAGDRVRITAQLIEAATDQHLWAESYERDFRDILSLQSEVAKAIAREVKIQLTPQEQARLDQASPVDPEAYENYLKGRFYWNKRNEQALEKAIFHFERAIERAPLYAAAHAGAADAYDVLGWHKLSDPNDVFVKAKANAARALELDDTLAEAHAALGAVLRDYEWDWVGAEREFQRALELDSRYSTAHQWYGAMLVALGRTEEGLAQTEEAIDCDPLSPSSRAGAGWACYLARRYDRAVAELEESLEIEPGFLPGLMKLGLTYLVTSRVDDSLAAFEKARAVPGEPPTALAGLAYATALSGRTKEAEQYLDQLLATRRQRYVSASDIAQVYLGLGDRENALTWLETAYQERSNWLVWAAVDPVLDPVRGSSRFEDLLLRVGLPAR